MDKKINLRPEIRRQSQAQQLALLMELQREIVAAMRDLQVVQKAQGHLLEGIANHLAAQSPPP
jgi:hypothetical protein